MSKRCHLCGTRKFKCCFGGRWDSAEDQQAYMSWRVETGLFDAIAPFMQGELIQRTFDFQSDV